MSQDIEEFSTQASLGSSSISDFSDESQTILRNVNQIVVLDDNPRGGSAADGAVSNVDPWEGRPPMVSYLMVLVRQWTPPFVLNGKVRMIVFFLRIPLLLTFRLGPGPGPGQGGMSLVGRLGLLHLLVPPRGGGEFTGVCRMFLLLAPLGCDLFSCLSHILDICDGFDICYLKC